MLASASAADAGVFAYPSSQTIPQTGPLPQDETHAVRLNAAVGEREGAWIVVTGAKSVSAVVDSFGLGPLRAEVYFASFVNFSGRYVPDALLPWDGLERPVEKPNQPLYLQVVVPNDAKPGGYRATVQVTVDGVTTNVPVAIRVFNV